MADYQDIPIEIAPGVFKEASGHAALGRYIDGTNVRFWKGYPERIGGYSALTSSTLPAPPRGMLAWRSLNGTLIVAFGCANGLYLLNGSTITDITDAGYSALTIDNRVDSESTFDYGEGNYGSNIYGGGSSLYSSTNHCTTWTLANWGEDLIACPRGTTGGGPIYLLDTSTWIGLSSTDSAVMSVNAPSAALGIFMSDTARQLVAYGAHDGSALDPLRIAWCDTEDYTTWTPAATNQAGFLRCEVGNAIVGAINSRGGHLICTDMAIYYFSYVGLPFVFNLKKIVEGPNLLGPNAGVDMEGTAFFMGREHFYAFDGSIRQLSCDVHRDVYGDINLTQGHKVYCRTNKKFGEVWWFYCSADSAEVDRYVAFNPREGTWFQGDIGRTSWCDGSPVIPHPIAADCSRLTITAITKANPGVVTTSAAHGLTTGDSVYIYDVGGMTEVNNIAFTATVVSSTTFSIGVNSSAYTTYTGGGVVTRSKIYVHEYGTTANGSALEYSLEANLQLEDGPPFLHMRKLVPDYERISGSHEVTIKNRSYPAREASTKGPYALTEDTYELSVRARGRQMRLLWEGDDDFRMGRWHHRVRPHGGKP
jgi:hypothetical protein